MFSLCIFFGTVTGNVIEIHYNVYVTAAKSFISMKIHNKVSSSGIPTVHIEYMATWNFINILPKECDDISLLLNHTEAVLEDVLRLCNTTAVDFNMTFSYRTFAFMVKIKQTL